MAPDISRTFDRVWHAGLLYKLKSYGISVQMFGLFVLFTVIEGMEWFLSEKIHKNIQLIPEFLCAPFLILHFSYYTLMILMLSMILLSLFYLYSLF